MCKVHRNVVASYVGGHCNYRGGIELTDQMARRNAIEVGHDNVHEHEVVLGAAADLVHGLEAIQLEFGGERSACRSQIPPPPPPPPPFSSTRRAVDPRPYRWRT